jgi:hypothetical protein
MNKSPVVMRIVSGVLGAGAMVLALASCGGGTATGVATFSCNVTSTEICTQITVPEAEVAAETATCTSIEAGTPGTACPTAGVVGCCVKPITVGTEDECYYNATLIATYKSLCTSEGGTWSSTVP